MVWPNLDLLWIFFFWQLRGFFFTNTWKVLFKYAYKAGKVVVDASRSDRLIVYCLEGEDQSGLVINALKEEGYDCYATIHRYEKIEPDQKTKEVLLPVPICVFGKKDLPFCKTFLSITAEIAADVKTLPKSWLQN